MSRIDGTTDRHLMVSATAVAVVATACSLYLSLGMGLTPCDLCWYQRILMYPLVVVFGVAAVERRGTVYRTALVLASGGVAVAGYHSWLQIAGGGACSFGGGCTAVQFRLEPLGLTVPNLALLAFAILVAFSLALWLRD